MTAQTLKPVQEAQKRGAGAIEVVTPVALTDASTITPDLNVVGAHWTLLATSGIGALRTLANPTNPPTTGAMPFSLRYQQDATGGRKLSFGNKFVVPSTFMLNKAANSYTVVQGIYYADLDSYVIGAISQQFGPIAQDGAGTTITTSTTKTTAVSFTVPGTALGTANMMEIDIPFEFLNGSGSTATLLIEVSYGGTVMYSETSTLQTSVATLTHPGCLNLLLFGGASTAVQKLGGSISMGNAVATTTGRGDMNTVLTNATGFATPIIGVDAAVDSTADQTFTVAIQMSVSNAATLLRVKGYCAYMLGGGQGPVGPSGPSGAGTTSIPTATTVVASSRTMSTSDIGKITPISDATLVTLTAPSGSVFSNGDVCYYECASTGQIKVQSDGTSIITNGGTPTTRGTGTIVAVVCKGSDKFAVVGNLA